MTDEIRGGLQGQWREGLKLFVFICSSLYAKSGLIQAFFRGRKICGCVCVLENGDPCD